MLFTYIHTYIVYIPRRGTQSSLEAVKWGNFCNHIRNNEVFGKPAKGFESKSFNVVFVL